MVSIKHALHTLLPQSVALRPSRSGGVSLQLEGRMLLPFVFNFGPVVGVVSLLDFAESLRLPAGLSDHLQEPVFFLLKEGHSVVYH